MQAQNKNMLTNRPRLKSNVRKRKKRLRRFYKPGR